MPEPGIDIADLLNEVQKEAAAIRKERGPSAVPPTTSQKEALDARPTSSASAKTTNSSAEASALSRAAHPAEGAIHSHRGKVGPVLVLLKKALRQLLRPSLDRQASFNLMLIQALEARTNETRAIENKLRSIQKHLDNFGEAVPHQGRTPSSFDFNYAAFETRYRGSPEHIREIQTQYRDYFGKPEDGPVLDLGCGRGEFLELLQENSVPCFGVDLDEGAVKLAQDRGLGAEQGELIEALESCADESLGGIVSFQVIEHLPLHTTSSILELGKRKLRPGGILILETVNVASLYTHAHAFTMDPTHAIALHPLTLQLMVEDAQFSDVQIVYSGEVPAEDRMKTDGFSPELADNFHRLNTLLFSPQDFAIVAKA